MKTDNKNSYHADGCLRGFPRAMCPEHGSLGKPVSPKAAEAPEGQEREITEAEIANFYKAGTKPWTTEIIDNQAVVWVLRSEAEAALTLAAPAAPSERADDANAAMNWASNKYLQDYGAKGGPAQVTMGVIRRCERLAFFAGWQARAGLSPQEGK